MIGPRRGHPDRGYGGHWFSSLQAVVIAVAGTLALWVTIDFNFDGCHYESLRWCLAGRMAAVPGLFLLLLAAIVMAGVAA